MTKRILIAAGAVAVLSLSSIRALGCLCGISSVEGVFHTSKIVFIGKVTKIKTRERGYRWIANERVRHS